MNAIIYFTFVSYIMTTSSIVFPDNILGKTTESPYQNPMAEMVQAEIDFSATSVEKGIKAAFLTFFHDTAVVLNPEPINGYQLYKNRDADSSLLVWKPIRAEIAASGDVGYTTGPYEFKRGKNEETVGHGNYVSIWKKQENGDWKVIFDTGVPNPKPSVTLPSLDPTKISAKSCKKKISKRDKKSSYSSLSVYENDINSAILKNNYAIVYPAFLTDYPYLMRINQLPHVNKDKINEEIRKFNCPIDFQNLGGAVASSNDFGYTYGSYQTKGGCQSEKGYYLRIWTKQNDGDWKVTLDLLKPVI